jgi:capsular exopolysaccharide synthesis family protein
MIGDPRAGTGFEVRQAAAVATLGAVPDRVAARLGVNPQQVRSKVSAATDDKLGELLITGRSTDQGRAVALADVTAEELIVELGGPKAPIQTLERAVAAPVVSDEVQGPVSRPGRALLLGLFGLLLGLGAALGVDRFDSRIRSKGTAEAALGFPVLAEVPPIPWSARGRLLTGTQPSPFIEAYRGLRTVVDRRTSGMERVDGRRVIVVTSPVGEEGTTSTVAHLSVTLAEVGRSVLVVSADLRRPRLHLYFDRPREPGLTDMLRGAPDVRKLTDLNLTTAIERIRFVASGAPVRNTAVLIERAGDLLEAAANMADFVLVDSPALLGTSDAAELAVHADEVLLVVRAGRTSVGAAQRSVELLQRLGVPLMGVVLIGSGFVARGYPKAPKGPAKGH